MHNKLINLGRRKFNKIFIFNITFFLTTKFFLYKENFLNYYPKNKQRIKWILSENDL